MRAGMMLVLLGTVLSFAFGCGGDNGGDSPSTPTAATTSSSTAATNSESAAPVVARVIEAARSGDPAQIAGVIDFQMEACAAATPTSQGGPPVCRTGEAPGTIVEGILTAECESRFTPRDELSLEAAAGPAFEFFNAYAFRSFPAGAEYMVVFRRPRTSNGSTAIGYVTNGKGVVAILYGCAWTPEQFVQYAGLGEPILTKEDNQ